MFGVDDNVNNASEGIKKAFINSLSDDELSVLIQLDKDIFDKGIDGVRQAIEDFNSDPDNTIEADTDTSSLDELQKAYENISKSADSFIKNQKSVKSALEEQEKYGQLSANTIRELSAAGYGEALVTDTVTGAVTLNVQAYEKLNQQKQEKIRLDLINERNSLEDKLKDEQTAVSNLRQEYEALAKADMESNAGRLSEITLELAKRGANIDEISALISQINGDITSLNAPTFDNGNGNTDPISEQKKLADNINEAYESQIETIDRQIEAIKKVSEAEERQKKILEAEKDVKEAMQELDKAKTKKRLVLGLYGSYELKEDKSAVDEAKKNLADKQESLDKAKEDEKIAALEEQKKLLENQKNDSKAYYDKVVEDLEEQKSDREKQYNILVDIYEQLGGEKRQTSLNDGLVAKLTAGGDISKAVQSLSPTELQQAFSSGILTTNSNGNYAIDYTILGKNQQAVTENTAEIEKAKSELERLNANIGNTQDNTASKTDLNSPHLNSENYLVGADGKQILNDGKPIKAKRNPNIVPLSEVDVSQIKDKQLLELVNILKAPVATPIPMNISSTTPLRTDTGEIMNISTNNTPTVNLTMNVSGSVDEKVIPVIQSEITNALIEYTDYFGRSIDESFMRQINKSSR